MTDIRRHWNVTWFSNEILICVYSVTVSAIKKPTFRREQQAGKAICGILPTASTISHCSQVTCLKQSSDEILSSFYNLISIILQNWLLSKKIFITNINICIYRLSLVFNSINNHFKNTYNYLHRKILFCK